jgi:hypothetical protein
MHGSRHRRTVHVTGVRNSVSNRFVVGSNPTDATLEEVTDSRCLSLKYPASGGGSTARRHGMKIFRASPRVPSTSAMGNRTGSPNRLSGPAARIDSPDRQPGSTARIDSSNRVIPADHGMASKIKKGRV